MGIFNSVIFFFQISSRVLAHAIISGASTLDAVCEEYDIKEQ